jgi:hypothetical protein
MKVVVNFMPWLFYPPGKCLCYTLNNRRLGGWQSWSGYFQARIESTAQHSKDYTILAPLVFPSVSAKSGNW